MDLCTAACSELGGAGGAVFGLVALAYAAWQRRAREQLRNEKDAVITALSLRPPSTVIVRDDYAAELLVRSPDDDEPQNKR